MVVADLPFGSYQASPAQALDTAARFVKEGGAHAVKLEGGARVLPQVEALVAAGIPVMAHLGLTPQSVNAFGGYRVQGRGEAGEQLLAGRQGAARTPARSRSCWRWCRPTWPSGSPRADDPDHRHRRRGRLRRPGAGLAGHGRPARRPRAPSSSSATPTCRGSCAAAQASPRRSAPALSRRRAQLPLTVAAGPGDRAAATHPQAFRWVAARCRQACCSSAKTGRRAGRIRRSGY